MVLASGLIDQPVPVPWWHGPPPHRPIALANQLVLVQLRAVEIQASEKTPNRIRLACAEKEKLGAG